MLVSDQTFPYPADALEGAREMRQYFQLMAELERNQAAKPRSALRSHSLRAVPAHR